MGDDAVHELTIDELAREAGQTTRNIRSYQSRRLLEPPVRRGRRGFYGPDHLARLRLIRELQGEGFNLDGIQRLLERAGGSEDEVLRFVGAARAPFSGEQPLVVSTEDLARTWGVELRPVLERAIEMDLLRPLGDGRFEQASPTLARVGGTLAGIGVSSERVLDAAASLRKLADGVAGEYVQLFLEEVWQPFDAAGRPAERWPDVRESLESLRPLAATSLLAVFEAAMREAVDGALEGVIGRLDDDLDEAGAA